VSFIRFGRAVAIAYAIALASAVEMAQAHSTTDTTAANPPPPASRPASYSAIACAAGFRIATVVRFPIGAGLGLAVCVAGIALDLDARMHPAEH